MTQVTITPESGLLGGRDRIVVAAAYGRVRLFDARSYTTEGEVVRRGDVVARVEGDATAVDLCAPCDAWVMGFLVADGQQVEPGTAVAHLRSL